MSRLYMMVTITNRNMKNRFREFYGEHEHEVFFGTLARGTANSEVLDYFGLEASEKVVFFFSGDRGALEKIEAWYDHTYAD